jgi:hypothetical protein
MFYNLFQYLILAKNERYIGLILKKEYFMIDMGI